ncbi:MAG TPA: helix-hairpin-helix domain-containing protein [Ktedonobacterales bacterium]|nr:helix-hairpin-helix domain-containing protein [Ktedonobacterales bacterium]
MPQMTASEHELALRELRQIPGVGMSIAQDFLAIGIRRIADLRGADPDDLYARICAYQGAQVDRCMLYVCRCAVYFAAGAPHDPDLLKWWNWKDAPVAKHKN